MSCCGDWCGNSDWCGNKNEGEKKNEFSLKEEQNNNIIKNEEEKKNEFFLKEKQNNNINKNEEEKKNKVFKKEKQNNNINKNEEEKKNEFFLKEKQNNNNINKNNEENKIDTENTQQKEYFLTQAEEQKIESFFTENDTKKQINDIKIPEIKVKLGNNLYLMYIEEARSLTNGDIKNIKDFAQNYNVTKIHDKNRYFSEKNKYEDIFLIKKLGKEKINYILNTLDVMQEKNIGNFLYESPINFHINHIKEKIFSKIDDSNEELLYYYFAPNGRGGYALRFQDCTQQQGTESEFFRHNLFQKGKNFKDFQQEIKTVLTSKEVKEFIEKQKQMANKSPKNNLTNKEKKLIFVPSSNS